MALLRDEVVVVKSINYGEADKILTLFGRFQGKFTVIAKGLRKMTSKNRGNMQTLSLSKISFYEGKSMGILRESELISAPDITTVDTNAVQRILLMLNKMLPEGQREEDVFNRLKALLTRDITGDRVNRFRMLFLRELGFMPDPKSCSVTGDTVSLKYFNPNDLSMVSESAVKQGLVEVSRLWVVADLDYGDKVLTDAIDIYVRSIIDA